MLREYIISEAMYNLNIPSSRSLAILNTGENIYRQTEKKRSHSYKNNEKSY